MLSPSHKMDENCNLISDTSQVIYDRPAPRVTMFVTEADRQRRTRVIGLFNTALLNVTPHVVRILRRRSACSLAVLVSQNADKQKREIMTVSTRLPQILQPKPREQPVKQVQCRPNPLFPSSRRCRHRLALARKRTRANVCQQIAQRKLAYSPQ